MLVAHTSFASDGGFSLSWKQPTSWPLETPCRAMMAFKYFQFSCGHEIHGVVQYLPLFVHVLQVAHTEATIWHATVALGSFHKTTSAPPIEDEQVFGLRHYNKALKLLNEKLSSNDKAAPTVVLAASLLFATFETLQKEYDRAMTHVYGSLNYLYEITEEAGPDGRNLESDNILPILVDVFERLEVSSSLFLDQRTRPGHDPFASLAAYLPRGIMFYSTASASQTTLFCLSAMRHLQSLQGTKGEKQNKGEFEVLRNRLLLAIHHWEHAADSFHSGLADSEQQQRGRVLRMYIAYCKISVSVMGDSDDREMRYDLFICDFERMLGLAITFLHNDEVEACAEGSFRYPCFSIHIGVIHILWFVAITCRDPAIRHGAIKLLKRCSHREYGSIDGTKIAKRAEMVVDVEEREGAHCAADVGVDKRIHQVWYGPRLDDTDLHCKRRNPGVPGGWTEWKETPENSPCVRTTRDEKQLNP